MYTSNNLNYFVGSEIELILQKEPTKSYFGILQKVELSEDENPIDNLVKNWQFKLVQNNNIIISFYPKDVKYINRLKS